MKTHHHYYPRLFLTALLTGSSFLFGSADKLHAQTPKAAAPEVDPTTHAAHIAAGTMPSTTAPTAIDDPALIQKLSQLQAKIAQLEAALAKNAPPMAAPPAGATMPGMPAASPAMRMGMDKIKSGGSMPAARAGAVTSQPMAGMGDVVAPAGGSMGMMGMMDKMMGMMDQMMPMGGSAPMPSGGAMNAGAPAAAMSGGMGMDKMEMAGMMGMDAMNAAAPGAMPKSALPGFPGASHLYHIGATSFFLDHPQHIALTSEQQAGLNKAKEEATLAKSTADRKVEQAEQALWALTAADQPDAAKIEAKIREIEKLRGDERLAFIHAVGEASKLLTDEQRKILTGVAPPAPSAPAAAPMAPMKDM